MRERNTEWWERLLHVTVWFGKWFFYAATAWAVLLLLSNTLTDNSQWSLMFNSVGLGVLIYFLTILIKRVVFYVVRGD